MNENNKMLWVELYAATAANRNIPPDKLAQLTSEAYDAMVEKFKEEVLGEQPREFGFVADKMYIDERPIDRLTRMV